MCQAVVQHDFTALSWHFYHREVGRWTLYTEVGTPHSRLHLLSTPITEKTAKLQRFIQFARARLIGSRVTQVYQAPYDRLLRLSLDNHGTALFLFIRLYSGSGANIIVTDEHLIILDLLLRRPRRGEVSGAPFDPGPERTEEGKPFTIRARTEGSFNRQIEAEYSRESSAADLDELLRVVRTRGEREIEGLRASIASQKKSLEASADHEQLRKEADLLSANAHLLSDNADEIELFDWKTNAMLTIALDSRLKGRAQIQRAYERYQKAKGASEHALGKLARLEEELAVRIKQLEELLCPHNDHSAWIADLKRASEGTAKAPPPGPKSPGLVIRSGAFTLLVGRNAKENDELLRRTPGAMTGGCTPVTTAAATSSSRTSGARAYRSRSCSMRRRSPSTTARHARKERLNSTTRRSSICGARRGARRAWCSPPKKRIFQWYWTKGG